MGVVQKHLDADNQDVQLQLVEVVVAGKLNAGKLIVLVVQTATAQKTAIVVVIVN